jgi:hypothetical protein
MLHLLEIKLDQFHADRLNRAQFAQACYPGGDVADAALEGWW